MRRLSLALLAFLAACAPRLVERDYEFRVSGTTPAFTGTYIVSSGGASVGTSVADSTPKAYHLRGSFITMAVVKQGAGSLRLEVYCADKLVAHGQTDAPSGHVSVSTPARCVEVEESTP